MANKVDLNKGVLINNNKNQKSNNQVSMEQVLKHLIQDNKFLVEQFQQLVQQCNITTIGHYALEDLLMKKGILTQEERDASIKEFVDREYNNQKENDNDSTEEETTTDNEVKNN